MFLGLLVWLSSSHVTIVTFRNIKQANRCDGSILRLINLKLYTVVLLPMTQLYAKNKVSKFFHFFVINHWKSLILKKSWFQTHRQTHRHKTYRQKDKSFSSMSSCSQRAPERASLAGVGYIGPIIVHVSRWAAAAPPHNQRGIHRIYHNISCLSYCFMLFFLIYWLK